MPLRTGRNRADAKAVGLARGQRTAVADLRRLAPETLHQLIRRQGLEASADLVTAATPEQLRSVADLDVWRAMPGREATLDLESFGEWLELLAQLEPAVAARTIAAVGEDLVVAGLSQYVRVFDPGVFMPTAQSDDEAGGWEETVGDTRLEVGGYVVYAQRPESWEAILDLLVALDAHSPGCFHALMRGCRRLSNSAPEVDGLDELLTSAGQFHYDLAREREERLAMRGYSTAADARAFLDLARRRRASSSTDDTAMRSVVEAWFREAWPSGAEASGDERRERELAFLANTLMAGCSLQGRRFTPTEAAHAAAAVCRLGRAADTGHVPTQSETDRQEPRTDATEHGLARRDRPWQGDLIAAFEAGWSMLYARVSLAVAQRLVDVLADLACADPDLGRELLRLRRELTQGIDAGAPWRARDALDAIATLDLLAWTSLLGLLSECPVLPETVVATLECRTGAVSASSFAFVSTLEQVGAIDEFMAKLPHALGQ